MTKYTKEEEKIVDYIESWEAQSSLNLKNRISQIKNIVKQKNTRKRQVNLRMLESDISKLKATALSEWIPYQSLMQSVIHKYLQGKLISK